MKKLVMLAVLAVFAILIVLTMPVLDPSEGGFVVYLAVAAVSAAAVYRRMPKSSIEDKVLIGGGAFFGAFAGSWLLALLIGSALFTSETRYNVLQEVTIERGVDFLMESEPRSVTAAMATKKAQKVLGREINGKNISSQYQLGVGSVINFKGNQVWAFPLEYKSFFKWLDLDKIPGYVLVSAGQPQAEPEFVAMPFSATPSAFWADSLTRKLWVKSGFLSVETHFEINESGRPFWVSAVLEKDVLYSIPVVAEVIITDAVTGESRTYPFGSEEIPSWVDNIVPEDVAEDYIDWNGKYGLGFFNAIFAGENVETTTKYSGKELYLVNVAGKQYYYSGMSSDTSSDDSLVSVRFLDPLSGSQVLVKGISGAFDQSAAAQAVNGALGANAQLWEAQLPQLITIEGSVYYTASIVSIAGQVYQETAAVDARNPSKVYFGETLDAVLEKILRSDVESIGDDETVTVPKRVLLELLNKIEELEELKKQLQ